MTCQEKWADEKQKAVMLHAVSILGLTEPVILMVQCRSPCTSLPESLRNTDTESKLPLPSQCSSPVFLPRFYTKSVTRKWRVSFSKFLILVWNLIWSLKVKSKYGHHSSWKFPRPASLLLCILCNYLYKCKILMTPNYHLTGSTKWEAEWNTSGIRTASVKTETKRNVRNLMRDLRLYCYLLLVASPETILP